MVQILQEHVETKTYDSEDKLKEFVDLMCEYAEIAASTRAIERVNAHLVNAPHETDQRP